uniref:Uncharacterized protein n=1 Tax=Avena sativa TaxID=4498 RepID=A0ACD5Y6C9_AVESA
MLKPDPLDPSTASSTPQPLGPPAAKQNPLPSPRALDTSPRDIHPLLPRSLHLSHAPLLETSTTARRRSKTRSALLCTYTASTMVYTYTPTYYSGLQDTIASVCKSIFSRPGRRLTADQAAARRHADALKWQQESFHRILHLSALHREGIVPATDVQAFRASVLAALATPPSPQNPDHPPELLRAKCISPAEFNVAKGPLVRRLAALGVAVDCPDADAGRSSAEEWAEIDLRDPPAPPAAADKPKHKASFVSPWKSRGGKKDQDPSRPPLAPVDQNHHASVLMAEISPAEALPSAGKPEKGKRRHLTAMFGGENKEPAAEGAEEEKSAAKSRKKSSWGFDGLKKWKKAGGGGCINEDAVAAGECAPPRSSYSECRLEASPAVPDAKRAKKKLHSATAGGDVSAADLANDKVLVEETKKELSRIQAELSSTNRNLNFSDQQIEAISTKLPVEKSDLNTFFPKYKKLKPNN